MLYPHFLQSLIFKIDQSPVPLILSFLSFPRFAWECSSDASRPGGPGRMHDQSADRQIKEVRQMKNFSRSLVPTLCVGMQIRRFASWRSRTYARLTCGQANKRSPPDEKFLSFPRSHALRGNADQTLRVLAVPDVCTANMRTGK
ncbi:hypothetical protein [Desulfonema magnum]|uniref:Uncharacterized protein n=1 Tax=Desulfonema magnum TaxID=45655 RepID=A0A975GJX3_9BACT|nr:hypothetical protein [Desulfonema magnum]QTA84012.1 Uncharacterized protein dnm_000020 [Desulfonema magnum]